ncbi:MAG: histidine kinase [Acidobacteriota bacterium]
MGPYLAAWAPVAALLAAVAWQIAGASWPEAVALAVPLALIYAFICLAAWYPCQAVPLGAARLPKVMATHALAASLSTVVWLFFAATWVALLEQLPPFAATGERFPRLAPALLVAGLLLYVLAASLHYLVIAFEQGRQAEKRELELVILAREAELKALRAQIDPHFLFNAMNSISALVVSDPAAARQTCLALADFLRDSLRLGALDRITLAEEIELAEKYLAIEKVRFGPRLRVERFVDDLSGGCEVPPLLLQPLVENAVSKGIAGLLDGGAVRIACRRAGNLLAIWVENPFDPEAPAPRGPGVGLANVKARLAACFGGEGRLAVHSASGVFRVEIELPAAPATTRAHT